MQSQLLLVGKGVGHVADQMGHMPVVQYRRLAVARQGAPILGRNRDGLVLKGDLLVVSIHIPTICHLFRDAIHDAHHHVYVVHAFGHDAHILVSQLVHPAHNAREAALQRAGRAGLARVLRCALAEHACPAAHRSRPGGDIHTGAAERPSTTNDVPAVHDFILMLHVFIPIPRPFGWHWSVLRDVTAVMRRVVWMFLFVFLVHCV